MTLPMPTDSASLILETAGRLLEGAAKSTGLGSRSELVHLIGVGVATLVHTTDLVGQFPGQEGYSPNVQSEGGLQSAPTTDADPRGHERERKLNASIDDIRKRYGFEAIASASVVKRAEGGLVDG
jgi:hypothetical protein